MPEFFDESVLGVQRLASQDGGKTETLELTTPNRKTVATVRVFIPETKFRIMRALNLKVVYPLRVEVIALNNKVLFRIEKPFSMKEYVATLQDDQKRVIGTLLRTTTETGVGGGTYDYKLNGPDNKLIALLRGNWKQSGQLQVLDARGGSLGKVNRRDPAMGPGMPQSDKFHVVNIYAPPQSAANRLALIGTAVAIDRLCD